MINQMIISSYNLLNLSIHPVLVPVSYPYIKDKLVPHNVNSKKPLSYLSIHQRQHDHPTIYTTNKWADRVLFTDTW